MSTHTNPRMINALLTLAGAVFGVWLLVQREWGSVFSGLVTLLVTGLVGFYADQQLKQGGDLKKEALVFALSLLNRLRRR